MNQVQRTAKVVLESSAEALVQDLFKQWIVADEPAELARIHAKAQATIELRDYIDGRIAQFPAE